MDTGDPSMESTMEDAHYNPTSRRGRLQRGRVRALLSKRTTARARFSQYSVEARDVESSILYQEDKVERHVIKTEDAKVVPLLITKDRRVTFAPDESLVHMKIVARIDHTYETDPDSDDGSFCLEEQSISEGDAMETECRDECEENESSAALLIVRARRVTFAPEESLVHTKIFARIDAYEIDSDSEDGSFSPKEHANQNDVMATECRDECEENESHGALPKGILVVGATHLDTHERTLSRLDSDAKCIQNNNLQFQDDEASQESEFSREALPHGLEEFSKEIADLTADITTIGRDISTAVNQAHTNCGISCL